MEKLNSIIQYTLLSVILCLAFLFGAISASTLDFLGNLDAIKLLTIDFFESLKLYFNLNSYICGFVFLIVILMHYFSMQPAKEKEIL